MAMKKDDQKLSKKAHRGTLDEGKAVKGDAGSPAAERQRERQNESGRGSGEGKSGFERGDGHPTGR
jgi:hypothetical protein